jgi:signal transduction histidine kinase
MTRRSIRTRLTSWYLLLLCLTTITLAASGWLLLHQSIVRAADASLRARLEDVLGFIRNASVALPREEFLDEFQEYAQLTPGDALLEVRDDQGTVFCRPRLAGWDEVSAMAGATLTVDPRFAQRSLQERPFRVAAATVPVGARRYTVVAAVPMKSVLDAASTFGWMLIGLVPIVAAVGGLGGYLISRRALAPIDRFSDAVQAITLERLDRRLDVPAADAELQRFALTFNQTLESLEAAVGEMARLTAEASHELRTPVALIRTTAEVALSRERPAAEYRESLVDVLQQSERLSALVENLLALARADAGVEPDERQPVDMAHVIEENSRSLEAAMAQRSLVFDLDVLARPIVHGTAQALGRLAVILFDNAMKYTPAGGIVRVRVDRAANSAGALGAILEVSDSGMGVDPSERPRLFERFYRSAAARAAVPDGAGLGLSIARTIVLRLGGEIALGGGVGGAGLGVRVWLPADEWVTEAT